MYKIRIKKLLISWFSPIIVFQWYRKCTFLDPKPRISYILYYETSDSERNPHVTFSRTPHESSYAIGDNTDDWCFQRQGKNPKIIDCLTILPKKMATQIIRVDKKELVKPFLNYCLTNLQGNRNIVF